MKKRRPFNFLFFTDDLKMWYFKYIVGGVVLSVAITGLAIYFLTTQYARTITVLGINLPGTTNSPVNIARDMLLNFRTQFVYIMVLEAIVLVIIGVVASLYFAYRIMGPLERLENEIEGIISETTSIHPLTLRKGDYLVPVVVLLNKLLELVSKKQESIEEFRATLKGISTFIKDQASPEGKS